MISPEGMKTFARMQGYQADTDVLLNEPCAANDYAHEIVITRGALMTRYFFTTTPTLGEIAKRLAGLLAENEWLQ